jgi:cytosine/adenosine deaminase-related metal-dependent hydrolase
VNTHRHFYQIFTRNYPEVQNLELFPWLTTLYEYWKNIDPEVMRYATYSALGELVKGGCTTCFDHHYAFPNGVDGLMEAEFDAASQIGARMIVSRGSMSLSKKDAGLPPDSVVQSVDAILADSQRAVEKFHDPAPFSMRQVVLAPCSPFSVTKNLLVESAKLGRSLGVRAHPPVRDARRGALYHRGHGHAPARVHGVRWLGGPRRVVRARHPLQR